MGSQPTVRIDRVRVWESGMEAYIDAQWGDSLVTFFDAFMLNRVWYEAGTVYEFLLAGIAYAAHPAKNVQIHFGAHPGQSTLVELPENLDLTDAALFLPISEWDSDDYHFRGPVKQVKPFTNFLGQDGWKIKVTVMRTLENDADLDIYITKRVWQDENPPRVDQEIEGQLWLQGRLWSVVGESNTE